MGSSGNQKAIRALANPIRRRIMELLRSGEMSVNALVERFDVARPAISRHLRVLREARLVTNRSDHNVRLYSINPAVMDRFRREFDAEFRDFWRPQGSADLAAEEGAVVVTRCDRSFEVEVTASLPIPAEQAFAYCTEESLFKRWVGADATSVPQVGGILEASSALGGRLKAEYLAISPGSLVLLRLIEPLDPVDNLYAIWFDPDETGCRVTLRHYVRDEAIARLVTLAWSETLKVLRRHVTNDKGQL